MLGEGHIFVLRQFDVELILFFITYTQSVAAEVTASCDGGTECVLVVVLGVEDVELGMDLLGGMGAQFKFAVQHILHHLEHTILHLLGVVRLLDVFFQFP